MRGKLMVILLCTGLTSACGNNNTEQGTSDPKEIKQFQSVNYETPREQKNRSDNDKTIGERGGYPQSEQPGINVGDENTSHTNEDRYSNEKTRLISKYLKERKDIVQAQVSETDDRIIVGVITPNPNQNENPNLHKEIEKDVRRVEPNKDIVVYVDKIYWNQMRNMNSRPSNMNRDIQEKLNDFFGND
ncbi:YhcN/YlaJ family sporulation lipoprotein [Ornithinibacillus bavariensis]|uniref:Sporulation lipoprotein YhcN/YlaJ (Spore_YhcN_YlaJ) n=1 Tax=Ornithinibacillus bavariensis TaxID=545502 RepID=A0A919XBR1_9BACI|nr:YhcN/YlaJ family sporulation lipoprotein [Ornithinibacillus bavariensis]GIO27663.1 hypothetical protein J43TS3_22740 [Ornithinibacillus bavariensis]